MIDLHTHTTNSDGQQTVAELLQKAERHGLKFLSITDHETCEAYTELKNPKIRNLFSGTIIKGVEIYFEHDGVQNELLGYGIDIDNISRIYNAELRFSKEKEVMQGMHKAYSELGFNLSSIDVMIKILKEQGVGRSQILNELNNEQNLAHAKEKFDINGMQEFRVWRLENVVSLKGKHSHPRPKAQSMKEVSNIIRDAGGLVFMAHIWRVGEKAIEMLDYAREHKLIDGVEVYYQDYSAPFTKEQVGILEKYAKKHNLLVCGGSDCHRTDYPLSTLTQEQISCFFEPSQEVVAFVEKHIIPFYEKNIKYKFEHVRYVMRRSLEFARQVDEPIDVDMAYVIAAYHDIGEHKDRKTHEIIGAEMLLNDKELAKLFTKEQMQIMSQAVLEHRASNGNPKTVYGRIVSSADRTTSLDDIIKLTYGFRKKHSPHLTDSEVMAEGYNHIQEKFGVGGYAIEKMFFKDVEFENFLKETQELLADKEKFKKRFYEVNNLKA